MSRVGAQHADRTGDFARLVERARASRLAAKQRVGAPARAPPVARSKFHAVARDVAHELARTYASLERLTQLAKSTSMYGDPADDIHALTEDIKLSMAHMRDQLALLQDVHDAQNAQQDQHSRTVVKALSSRLQRARTAFLGVLQTRKAGLKQQYEKKKQLFGASPAGGSRTRRNARSPLYAAPAAASSSSAAAAAATASTAALLPPPGGARSGERASGDDVAITIPQHMLVQQPPSEVETRASAMQEVQATIVELSHIFERVSLLVAQQGELIGRIEDDVESAETHVLSTRQQLERALADIMSSRWLAAKLGAVAVLFVVIWLVFFV